ncbi:hypothetical protein ACLOJK_041731 [Asimina triloba]
MPMTMILLRIPPPFQPRLLSASFRSQKKTAPRRRSLAPLATAVSHPTEFQNNLDHHHLLKIAREKFTNEISIRSKDEDISLAKALLFVAAEDEAFMALNRDMDSNSCQNERRETPVSFKSYSEWDCLEAFPLAGKSIFEWLIVLDVIAKEVEAELISRDIGCHLMEVIEAVNLVLFDSRGFKRYPFFDDFGSCLIVVIFPAIMLSVIYIEICKRLGIKILGSRIGEDFVIWPQTRNPEELFRVSSGQSLFARLNGRCVVDPKLKASDLDSESLLGLDVANSRDVIGIALANLIRLHWKRASRMNHGLMLTAPLRPVNSANVKHRKFDDPKAPLLRPLNLRYAEAVQELSICMASAPVEEADVLEPFIDKLHLLRLESTWKLIPPSSRLAVP